MPTPRPRGLVLFGVALAALLTVLYIGVRVARTFLWFGPPPQPANYAGQLHELARASAGLEGPSVHDAWPIYQKAIDLAVDAEAAVTGAEVRQSDGTLRFTTDYSAPANRPTESDAARQARLVFEEHDTRGLPGILDQLGAQPAAVRPPWTTGGLLSRPTHDLNAARALVRALTARFTLAYRAGDDEEALAHLRRGLAIARIAGRQGSLIEHLSGVAAATHLLQAVREEVAARRPSEAAARQMLALVVPDPVAPIDKALEADRIIGLDTLYAMLPDSRVRAASRGAQMERLDEVYAVLIPYARQSRIERDPKAAAKISSLMAGGTPSLAAADMLVPAISKALQTDDQWRALHAGTVLMLAIEAHAAAHGAPPASLGELAPAILPELPRDPYSGSGFVYRVLPSVPGQGSAGHGYVLYSVGADGTDDGGKTHDKGTYAAFTADGAGYDCIINAPRPPRK